MAINPILPVYLRSPLEFSHGQGMYLYDATGRPYLDFASGIGVNALGHSHPALVSALSAQAGKLWHVSNLYSIKELREFAELIVAKTFADTVFFANSGTEAVECAIKMARKYHYSLGDSQRFRIISFTSAFHGRTLAALSASDREGCMTGFHPKVEGFDIAPWHNLQAVRDAITHESAAILVEPIQGEGGVRPASTEFMQGLRSICDEYGLLLICDEVQSGMGRTGKLFAYEWSGITPDIVTSAKALGCGFPLGACLASEKAASCMGVGSHGSTYSGNPLAMTVGRAAFNIIAQDSFQEQVRESGKILHSKLTALAQSYPSVILELRGRGLMLGLKVVRDVKLVARELEMRGLLTAPAGDNTLRVYPALIVEQIHIDEAIGILEEYCRENI